MSSTTTVGCNIQDMYIIHELLRSAFNRVPGLIAQAGMDSKRYELLDAHIKEITHALHVHHEGEDLALWDRMTERAPACALHVEQMRIQHAEIGRKLADVERAHAGWMQDREYSRAELVQALEAVSGALNDHLGREEPLVAEHVPGSFTQDEWNELRDHGIAGIPKERMLIQLGYMLRACRTEQERAAFWRTIPALPRAMYRLFGARKLSRELTELYGAAV